MFGEMAFLERMAQSDAERVLLVGKLVDEVTGVAPEREVGLGGRGVEGRACAVLILFVEQISGISLARPC